MNSDLQHIIDYSEGHLSEKSRRKFEKRLNDNENLRKDYSAFKQINEFMRSRIDLEEAKSDPAFHEVEDFASGMIDKYGDTAVNDNENRAYILNSVAGDNSSRDLESEIQQIKIEISELNVDEVTEGWVREWSHGRMKDNLLDKETERTKNYIMDSLRAKDKVHRNSISESTIRESHSIIVLRNASLAIAALITGLVLITGIFRGYDTGRLFELYYEPMPAISPVTRQTVDNIHVDFAEAVQLYKNKDYVRAAAKFSDIYKNNPSFISAHFYEGVTRIELEHYSRAVPVLSELVSVQNEYTRDAQWYLSLVYMRTGEKEKAVELLGELAEEKGYYSDRAKKLLRRLK